MIALIVICVLAMPLAVWDIVDPRGVWRRTMAWRYRDPAGHEPGDAALTAHRVGGVVGLIGLVVCAVVAYHADRLDRAERVRDARQQQLDQPLGPLDAGPLPVLGYQILDGELYVTYSTMMVMRNSECSTDVTVTGKGTAHVEVRAHAVYKRPADDVAASLGPGSCVTPLPAGQVESGEDTDCGPALPGQTVTTTSPIDDSYSHQLRPAGTNVVPILPPIVVK